MISVVEYQAAGDANAVSRRTYANAYVYTWPPDHIVGGQKPWARQLQSWPLSSDHGISWRFPDFHRLNLSATYNPGNVPEMERSLPDILDL